MDDATKLLKADHCMARKLPSYVRVFYSNPPDGLFVYRNGSGEVNSHFRSPTLENEDISQEDDVTGTPMDFSFYSLVCNTILEGKVPWLPDEEMYAPVPSTEARMLLSKFFLNVNNCELPVFVLCDSNKQLFGAHKVNKWYARCGVEYCGQCSLSCAETKLKELYPNSSDSYTSAAEVFSAFELSDNNALGKVVVELTWHELTLTVPQEGTSSSLMLEVDAGHENSKILSLWQQLVLLQKYLKVFSEAKASAKRPVLPVVTDTPGNVTDRILDVLKNQDHGVLTRLANEMKSGDEFFDLIQQVIDCKRPVHDATDEIWLLLTESKDIEEVTGSLNDILTEIKNFKLSVFVNPSASTFLGSVINKLLKGEQSITEVSEKKALEILIESGIEKLQQDFIYLMKSFGMDCSEDFKEVVNYSDRMDAYQHNINAIGKLYATLELVISTQIYLNLSGTSLSSLVKNVYKACINAVPSLNLLLEKPALCVKVAIPYERISSQIPKTFSLCRATLSSKSEMWKSVGVLLFTLYPIFPSSVVIQDETIDFADNEKFHFYKMETESDLFSSLPFLSPLSPSV